MVIFLTSLPSTGYREKVIIISNELVKYQGEAFNKKVKGTEASHRLGKLYKGRGINGLFPFPLSLSPPHIQQFEALARFCKQNVSELHATDWKTGRGNSTIIKAMLRSLQ
ncbi:hypothetical protein N0Y54_39405 [Nostoc punctiforme UO1]|uniref:hypothetical protein n=1 Tax=Nostoc punctiforme TaxID=272131 RepID=UPI0030B15EB6